MQATQQVALDQHRRTEAWPHAAEENFRRLAENVTDIIYRYRILPEPGFDYISLAALKMTGYAPADYYADPKLALRLIHPEDRALLKSTILSPTAGDGPLTVRLIRKDGTLLWTEQQFVPLFDAVGQMVGSEGIVRDVSDRVRAQEMLKERVEERTRELARRHQVAQGLHDILVILNSNRTLDEILDFIIAQACRLLETPIGAIYRLNRTEAILKIRASRGLDTDNAALNLPADWGALGAAVAKRQPVAVTDTTTAFAHDSACLPRERLSHLTKEYRALLAVPLLVKDDVYGAIAFFYHEARAFSDEEIRLAAMLSDQAALAIENARLFAAAQGKAVMDERQRLARDLHDSVTQALYGMTLYAAAAARLLSSGDLATATDHLREIHDTAQEALQEMRLLIFELRPPVLDREGLVVALRTRLEAVEGRSNLKSRLNVEVQSRLPTPIEQTLYRVAQEALNNVLKHACAQHVTVSLRQQGPVALLEIVDDGVGFDLTLAQAQGGLGLLGMAERVAALGGRLCVQSVAGAGTLVRVEVFL